MMAFKMKYAIETKYLPNKSQRRSGIPMPKVGFIVAHDTGNDGSTAYGNINWYTNTAYQQDPSAHTFIDDKHIVECIPATTGKPEKAWHVLYDKPLDNQMFGDDANDIAIGVELCYSYARGSINNMEAYKRYVWYMAYLCYKFQLDPKSDIVGHYTLDPGRKTDPINAFNKFGKTWDAFINDVVAEYADCTRADALKPPVKEEPKLDNATKQEAIKAIDELAAKGLISSPEFWKARVEEAMPVWAYMIIEARKLK